MSTGEATLDDVASRGGNAIKTPEVCQTSGV